MSIVRYVVRHVACYVMQAAASVAAQAAAACWRDTLAEELRHTDESLAAVPQRPGCNPMHLDCNPMHLGCNICVAPGLQPHALEVHASCRPRHAGCAPMRMPAGVAAACLLLARDDAGE